MKMSMNRTPDISCVGFHLKELEKFGLFLEGAVNGIKWTKWIYGDNWAIPTLNQQV